MLREKGFCKGVNLGGWLSQCDYSEERMNHFITEPDFAVIASWGLDHVRIPVDYNVLEDDRGGYREEGFQRLENAIGHARKNGLNVVIDLHKTAGFSFDFGESESGFFENEAYQERFCRLWEELARHFGDRPDTVAFELLNEVTDKGYIGVWNQVSRRCIERIRAIAPDTMILVGSYWNNSPEAVKDLDAPYDDKVVYNFHCYSPMKFTHQGASWVRELPRDERHGFDELGITPQHFEEQFASALAKAREHGADVYCGEYGVIENATPEDTVKWFRAINSVFEKHGIARAAWSYRQMNFGLSDERLDGVRDELIRYL